MQISKQNYNDFTKDIIRVSLIFVLIFISISFSIHYSFTLQMQDKEIVFELHLIITHSFVSQLTFALLFRF